MALPHQEKVAGIRWRLPRWVVQEDTVARPGEPTPVQVFLLIRDRVLERTAWRWRRGERMDVDLTQIKAAWVWALEGLERKRRAPTV